MRRLLLAMLLAAALLLVIWSLHTGAQEIDATPCQSACEEQHSACITACGERDNPEECEPRCDERLDDCMMQCR